MQPELAELVGDLAREALLAVPVGGAWGDDLVGEPAREVADLALLVGEVLEHQRAAERRMRAAPAGGRGGRGHGGGDLQAPPERLEAHDLPALRAARPSASSRSGFTATGCPTARSIGRSDSESE